MLHVMIDGLIRLRELDRVRHLAAVIRIPVEAWEVAARYLHTDPMTLQKDIARYTGVHGDSVDFAGLGQFRLLERIAITQTQNAVGQVARLAVREDIDQLRGEI